MAESERSPEARDPAPRGPEPRSPQNAPTHWRYAAAVALAAVLAFGGWGLWRALSPSPPATLSPDAARDLRAERAELEQLRQRVTTLSRSDQISREANRDLQGTLSERDEEIAGLRADVAFYERLVGSTAQRRGLAVHALRVQPQNGGAWHFTSTLTQNLNRGAVSAGRLTVVLEGTRGGKLQKLSWDDLRQQPNSPGLAYSFKYFQQIEGDVFLPAGVTPVRLTVRLTPQSGAAVEQSFTWAEATREGNGAVAETATE